MTEKHKNNQNEMSIDTEMVSKDIKCLVLLKLALETNIELYKSNGEHSHTGNIVIIK